MLNTRIRIPEGGELNLIEWLILDSRRRIAAEEAGRPVSELPHPLGIKGVIDTRPGRREGRDPAMLRTPWRGKNTGGS